MEIMNGKFTSRKRAVWAVVTCSNSKAEDIHYTTEMKLDCRKTEGSYLMTDNPEMVHTTNLSNN